MLNGTLYLSFVVATWSVVMFELRIVVPRDLLRRKWGSIGLVMWSHGPWSKSMRLKSGSSGLDHCVSEIWYSMLFELRRPGGELTSLEDVE